jgi:hypothetical protein
VGALRAEAVGHDISIVAKGLKPHETTLRVFEPGFGQLVTGPDESLAGSRA